jgi:transposase InsO family protein
MSDSAFENLSQSPAGISGVSPFNEERPVRPVHPLSRAHRRRRAAAETHRLEAARRRYLVAKIAIQFAANGPTSAQRTAVANAVGAGLLTLDEGEDVPSEETVRQLVKRWQAGARKIADYLDRPRSGRPPVALDGRLMDVIRTAAETQCPGTMVGVHRLVSTKAKSLGLLAPKYAQVKARYAAISNTVRSAARHGVLAAELDTLPHSTVPVTRPHEVWTIDEFTMPNWARAYDADADQWVSVRPDAVLVQDYFSRATVAYEIADPRWADGETSASATKEVDTETAPAASTQQRSSSGGFGLRYLTGAIFAAALPEVAPASTRQFAGYLPERVRWDHAVIHTALGKDLARVGVTVDRLPVLRPVNRGIVERQIGTLKGWCDELPGHRDAVIPADRLPQRITSQAHVTAKSGRRHRQLQIVRVDDLPTVETLRRAFDDLVRRYNTAHAHRGIGGKTPLASYLEGLAVAVERGDRPRSGRDILAMLPACSGRVTTEGMVHRVGDVGHRFSYDANGVWLSIGTVLEYRPDPLLRGLFAKVLGRDVFLEPLAQWATRQRPKLVAEQQTAIAEQVAARVDATRLAATVVEVAVTALENAAAHVDATTRRVAAGDASGSDAGASSQPVPPDAPALDLPAEAEFEFDPVQTPPPTATPDSGGSVTAA